jgi:hypothetical protein
MQTGQAHAGKKMDCLFGTNLFLSVVSFKASPQQAAEIALAMAVQAGRGS